ncbi:MAG: Uma2 family endonuclease [Leptospirales bacterium]
MKTAKIAEWTYEDYLALPDVPGPLLYEVIDGELYRIPNPPTKHQSLVGEFFVVIATYLKQNPLGEIFVIPFDVIFSPAPLQYVVPDLVFVSTARSAIVTEQNIQGIPDLIVEIISYWTERHDRQTKRSLYERFGVPEYWIVDPETETVQVFRLSAGRYPDPLEYGKGDLLESPLFPGLSISLSEVFPS